MNPSPRFAETAPTPQVTCAGDLATFTFEDGDALVLDGHRYEGHATFRRLADGWQLEAGTFATDTDVGPERLYAHLVALLAVVLADAAA